MGSTQRVAVDGIVIGAALVLFGLFVVLSVIPMTQAPLMGAAGAVLVGLYVAVVRRQAAVGMSLAVVGAGALAFLLGFV